MSDITLQRILAALERIEAELKRRPVAYMPSPLDLPPVTGENRKGEPVERKPDANEPFSALAFKIMTDPYVGKLTYFRVYSGKLDKGSTVINTAKDKRERIGEDKITRFRTHGA